jgi:NAD(P)-dependent dehydrogenase (short-subunit alcohol dehydrogenase family)
MGASLPLAGRAALITGGGSGIGLRCASLLRADGATVTLAGRSEERLRAAAAALGAEPGPGEVRWARCDVAVESDVQAAVAVAAAPGPDGAGGTAGGGLHLVVAAAGCGALGPVVTTPVDDWDAVMATNLRGTFLTFKHAGPVLVRSGGGSMVAISSVAGSTTHRFMAPYCVSKAGIDMLVRVTADELGGAGVRVNSVRPGLVDTDLVAPVIDDEQVVGDYRSQMPLDRVGQVDDVGAAVHFLLGDGSSWITGANLPVDGGHHLRRGPDYEPAARAFFGEAVDGIVPA